MTHILRVVQRIYIRYIFDLKKNIKKIFQLFKLIKELWFLNMCNNIFHKQVKITCMKKYGEKYMLEMKNMHG